ncbi:SOS response-associated peptidase family protein [Variovorax sp. M-6]|uniref:SOS response-associated peptidase family protein n=1 Tax=Variovorax sp. M-6 TaxID=3233041 RepID=UPI003F964463
MSETSRLPSPFSPDWLRSSAWSKTVQENRRVDDGAFGLLPYFAKELAYGRRTYNARSETVATLPSFRDAWRRSQRCVVPAEAILEPSYETSKAVRWRIQQPGEVPMGIAGIYTKWRGGAGAFQLRHADG